MALPAPESLPTRIALAAESVQAFLRLLGAIAEIKTVRKIKFSAEENELKLWVLMEREVLDDAERIYVAERDYLRMPGALPVDLHVVPLSEVPEQNLPPAETVLER